MIHRIYTDDKTSQQYNLHTVKVQTCVLHISKIYTSKPNLMCNQNLPERKAHIFNIDAINIAAFDHLRVLQVEIAI